MLILLLSGPCTLIILLLCKECWIRLKLKSEFAVPALAKGDAAVEDEPFLQLQTCSPRASERTNELSFPITHSRYPNGLILCNDFVLRQYTFLISLLFFPLLLLFVLFWISSDPPSVIIRY